jgi:hypothetical protein
MKRGVGSKQRSEQMVCGGNCIHLRFLRMRKLDGWKRDIAIKEKEKS